MSPNPLDSQLEVYALHQGELRISVLEAIDTPVVWLLNHRPVLYGMSILAALYVITALVLTAAS